MQNSNFNNDDRPTRVSGGSVGGGSAEGFSPFARPDVGSGGGEDERATRVSSNSGFGGVTGGGNSTFGGFGSVPDMGEHKTMVRGTVSEIKQVAWLYCRKGLRDGHLYQFRKKRNEVGRAVDCDVFIEDPYAGSHHGAVVLEENEWKFFDFASTNGTQINGKRLGTEVGNPITLNDNDVIEIGDTELIFKCI